jgi:hypothetical protein
MVTMLLQLLKSTIHQTGLSIIYTSFVLTGFIIFCASSFGGTLAPVVCTVTLLTATITNLVLLLVLILLTKNVKFPVSV